MRLKDERVLIGLGTNLGDRLANLEFAVQSMIGIAGLADPVVSGLYESPAEGGPGGQGDFLNAAVTFAVEAIEPHDLLSRLLEIEREAGRVRTVRNGPRTLDLDILLFGTREMGFDGLTIPHPRMQDRPFVLLPASEIAGEMVHSGRGMSIDALLGALADPGDVVIHTGAGWHHAVGHSYGF